MPFARIYNDHPQHGNVDYVEKFRDESIRIPARSFIEMPDVSEAHLFMGQYTPIRKYDNGDPINPKALRIEVVHPCQECKKEFKSVDLLKYHLKDTHLVNFQVAVVHRCQVCKEEFDSEPELLRHGVDAHQEILIEAEAKRKPRVKHDHSPSLRGSAEQS